MFGRKKNSQQENGTVGPPDFERIFEKYKSMVLGVALRYVRCREDANDVVQETFISVYYNYDQFDATKALEPWLKRITINAALMYIRKNYRYQLYENEKDITSEFSQMEEMEIDNTGLTKDDLLGLLQELPDGYRMVFNLYALDGLSHKEIAEYLEITESTSRTQLLKARKMLKTIIESKKKQIHERA